MSLIFPVSMDCTTSVMSRADRYIDWIYRIMRFRLIAFGWGAVKISSAKSNRQPNETIDQQEKTSSKCESQFLFKTHLGSPSNAGHRNPVRGR
ncbi:hypothetical protein CLV89_101312 [Tritonibacter scottomollicae]|uniref:Uncharacterized protein n=1 Tax=Tritonibacter scottomollicae TaxID=483013 RepID=A0A2T1ANB0_TRISK|nr:hypothetical protein CLV89_101312 [Tritonibacter scottomollicae]